MDVRIEWVIFHRCLAPIEFVKATIPDKVLPASAFIVCYNVKSMVLRKMDLRVRRTEKDSFSILVPKPGLVSSNDTRLLWYRTNQRA